jgi:hypothetical protein
MERCTVCSSTLLVLAAGEERVRNQRGIKIENAKVITP